MTTIQKSWERLPQETSKQYDAFVKYLQMPLAGEAAEKRSLANLSRKLGLASTSGVEKWSAENNWQERTLAYDTYMSAGVITVRETALKDFQQAVVTQMGAQLVVLDEILDRALNMLLTSTIGTLEEPGSVDVNSLKKLVDAIEKKDTMARRMAGLPTQFTTAPTLEEDPEDKVYIIGGITKADGES